MTEPGRPTTTRHAGKLFPSDLDAVVDGPITVTGRLVDAKGTSLVIADAFASCNVSLTDAHDAPLGSWLEVSGSFTRRTTTLTGAIVLAAHDGKLAPDGQFRRFSTVGRALQRRALSKRVVRSFFESRGYLEVDTPVRVFAPGTDVYLEPQSSGTAWLITSPEFQHKRLLAGGLPRIFEFARCSRRDEVGPWHQPEFTMLEWYCLQQSFEELLGETEALVMHLARALECPPVLRVNGRAVRLDEGFERLTVSEAFRQFAGVSDVAALAADDEDRYFQLMVDQVDPALGGFTRPVLLTHYPLSQAALAAPSASLPGYSERFELFIGGVELCNGYGELTCATTQRHRFEADWTKRRQRGLPEIPIDEGLLDALSEGLPPCSGNAVGFDRLLAVLLEQPLGQVVAFPVAVPR